MRTGDLIDGTSAGLAEGLVLAYLYSWIITISSTFGFTYEACGSCLMEDLYLVLLSIHFLPVGILPCLHSGPMLGGIFSLDYTASLHLTIFTVTSS